MNLIDLWILGTLGSVIYTHTPNQLTRR